MSSQRSLAVLMITGALTLALTAPLSAQTNLRAWAEYGQTWLVWDDDIALSGTDTYAVYRDSGPIIDVTTATLVGRLFPNDWKAMRVQHAVPGATYTIPDGSGGSYTLLPGEALLAYTPEAGAVAEHFAVVKHGDTLPPAGATVGPITPDTDPVVAHAQVTGIDAGFPFTLYAVWIHGHADHAAGTTAFPVMGNQHFNGTSQVFAVFEPIAGLPPGPWPAAAFLHGGDESYWRYRPGNSAVTQIDLSFGGGLYVTLDDHLFHYWDVGVPTPTVASAVSSAWFGYWEGWDRFASPTVTPPDDGLVVDYTQRRMDFIFDWLNVHRNVTSKRISLAGLSNGGRGVMGYVRARPERIASGLTFVQPLAPTSVPVPSIIGEPAQDLATTLPTGVGIFTFLDPTEIILDEDGPFLRMVWGTQDTEVPWAPMPAVIKDLDHARLGADISWDQRGHVASTGSWTGAQYVGSPRHAIQALFSHRNDRSYPAVFNADHEVATAGIQPAPGTPPVPPFGNPFGTWGGFIEWDPTSVVDTPTTWEVEIAVVGASPFPADVPPLPTATASVLVRRPQQFALQPFQSFQWLLLDTATGLVRANGNGLAGADGRAAVEGLPLDTTATILRLTALPSTWTDLGAALAGGPGEPLLTGSGSLVAGTPFSISLSGAQPGAVVWLVLGLGELSLPFMGGTMVPTVDNLFAFFTNGVGGLDLATLWPGGIPPGTEVYYQEWIVDPAAPFGFASSNGLKSTTL